MEKNASSARGHTPFGHPSVRQQVILSGAKNLSEEPTGLTQWTSITAPGAPRDSSLALRMTALGRRVRETPHPCHFGLHPFRGARLTPWARGFAAFGPPHARETTFDPPQTCVGGMSPSRDDRSRERRGVGTRRPHTSFGRLTPARRSAGRASFRAEAAGAQRSYPLSFRAKAAGARRSYPLSFRATAAGARSYTLSFRAEAASGQPKSRNLASHAGRRAAAHPWPPRPDSSARLRLARNDTMVRPLAHGTRRPPSPLPSSTLPPFHPSSLPPFQSSTLPSGRAEERSS
jgi:hypothetical protein